MPKKRAFWSRVERAGEGLEIGWRCLLGGFFAFFFFSLAYALGSQLWVGIGVLSALISLPLGFAVGFFWPEIRFALWLLCKLVFGGFGS